MKRGAPRHPKIDELATKLGIPRYAAVGLLEMLWHFTAEFALAGDIGRFSDETIAKALCYDDASTVLAQSQHDASTKLISCLVDAGWLDRCDCHRLRIHHWPQHADQTVHRVLKHRNQAFISCYDDASIKLASSYDDAKIKLASRTRTHTHTQTSTGVGTQPQASARAREPDPAEMTHTENDYVQYSEVQIVLKHIALTVFGERIAYWGSKKIYDDWLSRAVPMLRIDLDNLEKYYNLPANHAIFTDQNHPAYAPRRRSFSALLENLTAEGQKASTALKALEADRFEIEPWPRGTMQAFKATWPERAPPAKFRDLPEGDRATVLEKRKEAAAA